MNENKMLLLLLMLFYIILCYTVTLMKTVFVQCKLHRMDVLNE